MSEEINTYNEKSITYTELFEFIKGFAEQKIYENGHKDDPLKRDDCNLLYRLDEERQERIEAYENWIEDPTEENAVKFFNEVGDEFNILLFICGQMAGYTKLERM